MICYACALLATIAGPAQVAATYSARPVQYYMSSGIEIPFVPGPTAQAPSSAPAPTTAPTFAAESQASRGGQTPSVAYDPDQTSAHTILHTVVAAVTSALSSESAEANTQPTATIQADQVTTAKPVVDVAGAGVMTIDIANNWPHPLSISYLNNAGSPSALGAPQGAPLGTKTQVVYPTGWAGRIYVGSTINSADSKIEGSTTGANDIDVSYVDGYSVPITCSVGKTPVTGCNIDLWSVSGNCANPVGDHNVCLNPMQGVANGPAGAWFLPCQGAAYTFPNDNIANDGDTGTPNVSCCIGTAEQGCAAPARQGHENNQASKAKRSIAENLKIGAPSLLPRAHRHHLKRHLIQVGAHARKDVV
ncbi:hypothetical protein ACLMJK_000239 [Lecanora helva]